MGEPDRSRWQVATGLSGINMVDCRNQSCDDRDGADNGEDRQGHVGMSAVAPVEIVAHGQHLSKRFNPVTSVRFHRDYFDGQLRDFASLRCRTWIAAWALVRIDLLRTAGAGADSLARALANDCRRPSTASVRPDTCSDNCLVFACCAARARLTVCS